MRGGGSVGMQEQPTTHKGKLVLTLQAVKMAVWWSVYSIE